MDTASQRQLPPPTRAAVDRAARLASARRAAARRPPLDAPPPRAPPPVTPRRLDALACLPRTHEAAGIQHVKWEGCEGG